ncbi:hypothetical protein BDY17DRAFT_294333 [Neohortaea acidophila]|uniref:FAD-binding domain-containing protein n=1 Tax=Neohortaea acidophila TaxID=245834 RepID=A0A6A6Q1H8_9PEZI|nr:uncharacterized protein BDY17DRAFT_294333 [Neohortaea acidophila]KAF2485846.1 hypothetical protein BDY17DRAFT_294333 [Neohortaea acidophila]
MPSPDVAIIGGGLCGLALAIALEKRQIPYKVYEARSSFREIGSGINLGPNTFHAFNAIDAGLYKDISALATRNEPPNEETWMTLRLGRPTDNFEDGHLVTALQAPPTGNMTVGRNELLQMLAGSIDPARARFNKKLVGLTQSTDGVTLRFEDGTEDEAALVIGCDGAHSSVRGLVLGKEHPATRAQFSRMAGYRAVFPMDFHEQVVGRDNAHMSHVWCGPDGYVIHYPINGGTAVNIGLWIKKESWNSERWVVEHQKEQMLHDFRSWGPQVQRIMSHMEPDTTHLWGNFHHAVNPEHYFQGRAAFIGDAAHSMPPHQGQGAAQSMEDACVMAAVLRQIYSRSKGSSPPQQEIEAAFRGFETVRKARFEEVTRTSVEALDFWADVSRPDLTEADVNTFERDANQRFVWLWNEDIEGQQAKAVAEMEKLLGDETTKARVNGAAV